MKIIKSNIEVLSVFRMKDALVEIAPNFEGVIKIIPQGVLNKEATLLLHGDGIIEEVKNVSLSDVKLVVEARSGSVSDFISAFSKAHPDYAPVQLSKKEWVNYKRFGGIEDNLHPLKIV